MPFTSSSVGRQSFCSSVWPLLNGAGYEVVQRPFLAFAGAIAAWNLGAFIYPHHQPAADPVYALSLQLDRELPEHAKVFYESFSPDDWYLDYFAPGRRWQSLPSGNLAEEAPFCLETTAIGEHGTNFEGLRETKSWKLISNKYHVQIACFGKP